jgi:hypothetical protein
MLGTSAAARLAVIFDEVHATTIWYAVATGIDGTGGRAGDVRPQPGDPELAFTTAPVAVYFNDSSNQLQIRFGTDTSASSWTAEQTIDPAGSAGDPHDLINLNEKAAVAYFESNQSELKFARVF